MTTMRKRYSDKAKLEVAKKAKTTGNSIATTARDEHIPDRTLRRWTPRIVDLEQFVTDHEGIGEQLKAIHKDRTPSITRCLQEFIRVARSLRPPLPVTIEVVCESKSYCCRVLRKVREE
jgi:hypothetical protein